jgi:hypothetical protein
MSRHHARLIAPTLVLMTACFLLCGCENKMINPEEVVECGWIVGSATSGADGMVAIDMGELGTFRAKVRDGLTSEPLAGVQYICAADACRDQASYVAIGDDGYQIGVYYQNREEVIGDPGVVPGHWDDLFPWIGGDTPMPGIHGVGLLPESAWGQIRCSVTETASEAVSDMDGGLIAAELSTRSSGLLLATAYPPNSGYVLVYVCYANLAEPEGVLAELQSGVYLAQGYCETQEVRLVNMDGPCGGRTALDIALIEPVVIDPGCVPTEDLASLYGVVRDATTGVGIASASVAVNGLLTTSAGTGSYSVSNVIPSDRVLVTALASGYQPFSMVLAIDPDESVEQDIVLVPTAQYADQYRFVLTWGQDPQDLDSHLWVPLGGDTHFHVAFWNKGSLTAVPYAELDVDDVTSFGPETITLLPNYEGQYVYAVHHWFGAGTIATSGAVVQIYCGNNLTHVLNAPNAECYDDWWWWVGELNAATGQFSLINEYHQEAPLSEYRPDGLSKPGDPASTTDQAPTR